MARKVLDKSGEHKGEETKSTPKDSHAGNPDQTTVAQRRDLRRLVAAWFYQDKDYREPFTAKALAIELGISPRTMSRIIAKLPPNVEDWVKLTEQQSLARYMEVLQNMVSTAVGSGKDKVQAARFMQDIVEKHSKPKSRSKPELPKALQGIWDDIQEAKSKGQNAPSDADAKPTVQ